MTHKRVYSRIWSSALLNVFKELCLLIALSLLGAAAASAEPSTAPSEIGQSEPSAESSLNSVFELALDGQLKGALAALDQLLEKEELSPQLRSQAMRMKSSLLKRLKPRSGAQASSPEERSELEINEERFDSKAEGRAPSQGARTALVGATTLHGLSIYGPALATINSGSTRVSVGLYTLAASASLAAPLFIFEREDVNWAMTDLGFTGLSRGALHGALTAGLLDLDEETAAFLGLMTLGSVAEGALGVWYAKQAELSAGESHGLTVWHDIGTAAGLMSAVTFDLQSDKALVGLTLGGSALGFLGGTQYRRLRSTPWGGPHSWGNMELLRLSAALGTYAGGTMIETLELNEPSAIGGVLLGAMAGGALVGDLLIQRKLLSFNEALMIELSTFGGGLLGAALTYLSLSDATPTSFLWGSLIGATGAYALSYKLSEGYAGGVSAEADAPRVSLGPLWLPNDPSLGSMKGLSLNGQF